MRIGLFSDYYLASSDGTAIATEISRQALAELGHDVKVVCPSAPVTTAGAYVRRLFSIPIPLYPGLRASWPFNTSVLSESKNLDVIHSETPLPVGLMGLWAAKKLKKPFVVSAHLDMDFMGDYRVAPLALFGLALMVAIIARQPGDLIKLLFSARRNHNASWRVDFAWRVFAFFCDQADACVAISQKIHDQLSIYKQKDNMSFVPNGVSLPLGKLPDKQKLRDELGWSRDDFIVLSLARLVREKQVDKLIESMNLLSKTSKLTAVIMNEGPKKQSLKRLVVQYGLEKKVQFCGLVPRHELYKYIIAADVFVNTSRREVASLAVLEAALCAKPVLLFDERLIEPLEDGVNGFFVMNSKQLANKIDWLMKHPRKLTQMGTASRSRVKKAYSQKAHGRALEKIYKQLFKVR